MLYFRPSLGPIRSERSRNEVSAVPGVAPWMSLAKSPSPRPLSSSLLVMPTRTKVGFGSQMSSTTTVASMSAILWLGGHSE